MNFKLEVSLRKRRYSDAIGLIVLMIMVGVLATFVSSSDIYKPFWIPIYVAWAAGALFLWRKFDALIMRPELIAALSLGGALLWYLVMRGVAYLVFSSEEPELSRVFDLIVTLILSPGITFIALAGYVRELVYKKIS